MNCCWQYFCLKKDRSYISNSFLLVLLQLEIQKHRCCFPAVDQTFNIEDVLLFNRSVRYNEHINTCMRKYNKFAEKSPILSLRQTSCVLNSPVSGGSRIAAVHHALHM